MREEGKYGVVVLVQRARGAVNGGFFPVTSGPKGKKGTTAKGRRNGVLADMADPDSIRINNIFVSARLQAWGTFASGSLSMICSAM